MILEILEWCMTPASLASRSSGLLAEQISIRHRAVRCREFWRSHLQACKKFVADHVVSGGHIVILGSGHLRDFDLIFLKKNFSRITLVDAVHPLEVRISALFSNGRIQVLQGDLSGALHAVDPDGPFPLESSLRRCLETADTLVSSCLLTQLALPASRRWQKRFSSDFVETGVRRIQQNHIDLLRKASAAVLITDTAQRYGNGDWTPLLQKVDLPMPVGEWIWDIAPVAEHGFRELGHEQRRVAGFIFSNHENLCPIGSRL